MHDKFSIHAYKNNKQTSGDVFFTEQTKTGGLLGGGWGRIPPSYNWMRLGITNQMHPGPLPVVITTFMGNTLDRYHTFMVAVGAANATSSPLIGHDSGHGKLDAYHGL